MSAFTAATLGFSASVANVAPLRQVAEARPRLTAANAPITEDRVVIRFARKGRKQRPFFRLVAVDSKTRRDGAPIENLGFYDPVTKETQLNAPSIKKWISVGAKPSQTVENLLKKAMIIDP